MKLDLDNALVAKLDPRPGDIIVLRVDREMTGEEQAHVIECLQGAFPHNKTGLLAPGMSLTLIRGEVEGADEKVP